MKDNYLYGMLLHSLRYWAVWMFSSDVLTYVSGWSSCERELVGSINLTTELQSDILLPCVFEPALLGSNKSADVVVVWSQHNIPQHNLLEITLKGEVRSWDSKGGRIKTSPTISQSGNFCIRLERIESSDLGLYRCELFNGTSCSIAYQVLELNKDTELNTVRNTNRGSRLICDNPIYDTVNQAEELSHGRGLLHSNPIYANSSEFSRSRGGKSNSAV